MWHSTIQSVSSPNYKQNFKKAKSIKPYKALNSGIKAYKAHHQDTKETSSHSIQAAKP